MKLKAGELYSSIPALMQLCQTKMKLNPSFWLARQRKKVGAELFEYQEAQLALQAEYADLQTPLPEDASEADIAARNARQTEYAEKSNGLAAEELEVAIEQRKAEFLGDVDVSADLLSALHYLFEDFESVEPKDDTANG